MAAKGSYARKVFGDAFVDHFAATRVRVVVLARADLAVQRVDDLLAVRDQLGVRAVSGAGLRVHAVYGCTKRAMISGRAQWAADRQARTWLG